MSDLDEFRSYVDTIPLIVRVICGKHGRPVAFVRDSGPTPMVIAWRPRHRFPWFRARQHEPEFLTQFEKEDPDFGVHLVGAIDGLKEAWCRKGKHAVSLDPAALHQAVADYRRGTGSAVTLIV